MTGYGKADTSYGGKTIHAEIKSLNSKALDLQTRIAPAYREREMELRQLVAARLERGKVELTLWVTEQDTARQAATINAAAIGSYLDQIRRLSSEHGIALQDEARLWDTLLRLPEATTAPAAEELSEAEWEAAREAVLQAIGRLEEFRQQEGAALERKFRQNLDNIQQLLAQIEPYEQGRVRQIRQRLEERLAELRGVDYDKNRLEQELIYYIEKLDISEEKQRLANHLHYFRETMEQGSGQGKKLGFIAQEMGREINTTGSKSNQAEMQNIVVRMKDELEQIKEQVLNVM